MMTIPDLTLLFMGVVFGLGTALVWMFWELEPTLARLQLKHGRFLRDRVS
ncbi:hypothetical protein ACFFWD_14760 [Bradyrhizobium erythrophlei]